MQPPDYQQTVVAMVHAIRVNPLDETARMMLADYLEEYGRQGAAERCSRPLREGRMVLSSLDVRALDWAAGFVSCLAELWISTSVRLTSYEATLEQYKAIWDHCIQHRDKIHDEGVKSEALLIQMDRASPVPDVTKVADGVKERVA